MFLCFVRIQLFPPNLFRFLLHIQGTWQAMVPLLLIVRNSTAFSMELIQISGIRTLTILSRYHFFFFFWETRYQIFPQSASRYIPWPQIVLCLTVFHTTSGPLYLWECCRRQERCKKGLAAEVWITANWCPYCRNHHPSDSPEGNPPHQARNSPNSRKQRTGPSSLVNE